jgi:hypothetical protein
VELYESEAVKLAGPLPSAEALAYLKRLRALLESIGLEVVEATVADD